MIRSSNYRRRPACVRDPGGFTMIELLMVIIIISILIALLLPAINAAMRTARNAAVSTEIGQLAAALENFRSKYGDYPPSRVYLAENGYYPVSSTIAIPNSYPNDINLGQLAQRSLVALRKFFPRVVFSTAGTVFQKPSTVWYDFNGNGIPPASLGGTDQEYYILEGHECLVFFLGGIPLVNTQTQAIALTGFGKDPTNPFTNSIYGNAMYNNNRQPPFFEFNPGRLFLDPNNVSDNGANPGIPGYYDSFGNAPPAVGTSTINFYAYFSGYGSGIFDANDVNFATEADATTTSPIGLQFQQAGTLYTSPSPNPYTATLSVTTTGTVTFQKAQSFQIISSGIDGLYGVGGQYVPSTVSTSSATNPLPLDSLDTYAGYTTAGGWTGATTDSTIRLRERDNLTNFKSGTLQ